MDYQAKRIFLFEIQSQAQMSLNAIKALANVHNRMKDAAADPRGNTVVMHAEHFRTVHSFLTHLSNVSRLIWPPAFTGKKKQCFCNKTCDARACRHCVARSRAETIQEALGLTGENHVLKSRTLRDHLEHFDERLDEWEQNSPNRNFVQDYIGPRGGIGGIAESDMMRQLDPQTGDFIFRGEIFSLVALADGANDILRRTDMAVARGELM